MRITPFCLLLVTACASPELDPDAPFRDATRARVCAGGRFVDLDGTELGSIAAGFHAARPGGPNHGSSPLLEIAFEGAKGARVVLDVRSGSWETAGEPWWSGRLRSDRLAALEALLASSRAQTPAPPAALATDANGIVMEPIVLDVRPIVVDRENTWPWPPPR
jgi:hypothetical protein